MSDFGTALGGRTVARRVATDDGSAWRCECGETFVYEADDHDAKLALYAHRRNVHWSKEEG